MGFSIALEHLKGHMVAKIPGEPDKHHGMRKNFTCFIGPITVVHRLTEFETNHQYVQCLPPKHFIRKSVIKAGSGNIIVYATKIFHHFIFRNDHPITTIMYNLNDPGLQVLNGTFDRVMIVIIYFG